jgi:hypothetical protein
MGRFVYGGEVIPATALVRWKQIIPKMVSISTLTLPTPWPARKRHRVLCGRLSGSGWGGQAGTAPTFSVDLYLHRLEADLDLRSPAVPCSSKHEKKH